ncbi:MAG: site-2 protease family protein [Phycisphaerales bacterium]
MNGLLNTLGGALDLAVVVLGFGFIVFIHELGHFLAAKWAGIRVMAFALGFGPAAVSYRRGMGLRRGSSESAYLALRDAQAAGVTTVEGRRTTHHGISPTEYRLNWLPFGGYVKMLGQNDASPLETSDAPDSYQSCPPLKRMVVISAGVVMNILLAAALFIAVFMWGLKTQPPTIGEVLPGSPAERARPDGATTEAGLKPGDLVIEANGERVKQFSDLALAAAMSRRSEPMTVLVERPGETKRIRFELSPEEGARSRLREIGVVPSFSNQIIEPKDEATRRSLHTRLDELGLKGVEPGMRLVRAGEVRGVTTAAGVDAAMAASGGAPVEVEFADASGRRVTATLTPKARLESGYVPRPSGAVAPVDHLLGLSSVLCVDPPGEGEPTDRQGLETGDIFARVGDVEFPSLAQGIAEIRRNRGKTIPVAVIRGGRVVEIRPAPMVRREGLGVIGFRPGETGEQSAMVAAPIAMLADERGTKIGAPAASALRLRAGSVIVAVDGTPVNSFTTLREALKRATREAVDSSAPGGTNVTLTVELPVRERWDAPGPREEVMWRLSRDDVATLHKLGWTSPINLGLFEMEEITLRATGPIDAIRMGVAETHRVMMTTYVTFLRLFEGTVKVEHLKGPVGIAHIGTSIVSRGTIALLFFMALISVNLAVVNFLPLPIVDGGQFLFLLFEWLRGRPVPASVQGAASMAGMLLIGAVFLIVTFHDIMNLIGP